MCACVCRWRSAILLSSADVYLTKAQLHAANIQFNFDVSRPFAMNKLKKRKCGEAGGIEMEMESALCVCTANKFVHTHSACKFYCNYYFVHMCVRDARQNNNNNYAINYIVEFSSATPRRATNAFVSHTNCLTVWPHIGILHMD